MSFMRVIEEMWDRFETKVVFSLDSKQRRLWEVFVFLMRFLILAVPLHVLLWLNFDAYLLQIWTAKIVSFFLYAAGVAHETAGIFLFVPLGSLQWTIEIIKDCVGWKSFMAVSGLMFAVRKVRLEKRIAGVLVAAPIIYFGNAFRIFSSIYLTRIFGFEWFDFIHGFLWQWGLIALVILIWWVWLEKFADATGAHPGTRRKTKRK
ncbi:MAG: archaeosortase/exosortase family protein [archaeon]